ncbi:MAG TPA: hypothetical protein VGH28_12075 [Polyangiaceae bacterium]
MTDDIELQNLWLALHKKSWRVLAVVSAAPNGSTLDVANALADAALQYEGVKPTVIDLRDVKLRFVEGEKARLEEHRRNNESIVVALASPDRSPASLALAQAADAAIVVVRLGETSMKTAMRAADEIGRDKVVGAVIAKGKSQADHVDQPVHDELAPQSKPVPAALKITRFGPPPVPSAAASATQPLIRPAAAAVGATVKLAARSGSKH